MRKDLASDREGSLALQAKWKQDLTPSLLSVLWVGTRKVLPSALVGEVVAVFVVHAVAAF